MTIEARLKSIQAKDLMTRFAITATEDQTIVDLANIFMRFKVTGIPVVDEGEKIVGMITSSNLFDHMKKIVDVVDQGNDPKYDCCITVKEIMTPEVITIDEDMSLYDMIKLMSDQHIHTFPVVRGDKLVGVVGRRDVMNACYSTACSIQSK